MNTIDVSIIIVNYHTSSLINDCLRSIRIWVKSISYEIIIVDNNSEDLRLVINDALKEDIKLIQLTENIGFGRANNEGYKIAKGRHIFCLNPDTILINNAVKILSDYLDSNDNCGACGGNLFDERMRPTLSFRRVLPGIRWEINELFHLIPEKILFGRNRIFNYTDNPIRVGYITGADLMIKRDVYEKVKGFSPLFFMYYEDTDLCKQISNLQKEIINVPTAKIQHLEGRSFAEMPINYSKIERIENGRSIYMQRNFSKLHIRIANWIYSLFLYSRGLFKKSKSYKYRLSILKSLN